MDDSLPSAEHPRLINLLDSWLEAEETCGGASPRYCHLLIRQKEDVDQGDRVNYLLSMGRGLCV